MAASGAHLERFSDFEDLLYLRRYGGVIITHESLRSGMSRMLAMVDAQGAIDLGEIEGWKVARVGVGVARNYFHSVDDASLLVGDSYAQELYVAWRAKTGGPFDSPVALLLSPYIRLLNRILTRAKGVVGTDPGLRFLVPRMPEVFRVV